MNRWKEAFEKHPIHETLSWLADAASSNVENLSEQQKWTPSINGKEVSLRLCFV
ncbi:hypothetical protein [Shewanella algae]|uniref:hypothetical protein n=1 Tax=Shewanella algae TaxID=38313 RepID=UPI0031F54242